MDLKTIHYMLVKGNDPEFCRKRVIRFFRKNILIRYDTINIDENGIFQGGTSAFWKMVEQGIEQNHRVAEGLVRDLQNEGFNTLEQLRTMEQGYRSKILHTLTHLLDGFFGVDTCFYNLEEDSHWLSEELDTAIKDSPDSYWLLKADCSSSTGTTDFLEHLRHTGNDRS